MNHPLGWDRSRLFALLPVVAMPIAVGAANGGYFPSSWAWVALGALWLTAIQLYRAPLEWTRLSCWFAVLVVLSAIWMLVTGTWSGDPSSFLDAERELMYASAVLPALIVVRRLGAERVLGAVCFGICAVSAYSLATRLLPDRLGAYDTIAGNRLAAPVGYWNALAILVAMAIILALGFVTRGRALHAALAAASLVPLSLVLYFTYSRGAWIALGVGMTIVLAVESRRFGVLAAVAFAAPAPVAAVWLASQSQALTHQRSTMAAAARDGHRLGLFALVLGVIGGVAVGASKSVRAKFAAADSISRVTNWFLIGVLLTAVLVGVTKYGGPASATKRVWSSFAAPPPVVSNNLNERLFSLSGNGRVDLWREAWREFEAHPVFGGGAGSYEQWWLQHRQSYLKVRDAHSLYIERLAEGGIVGFALLVAALALPIAAVTRARTTPMVVFALGAYVAFLLHAGVDWDWEVPVVGLTGLLCGAAILEGALSRGVTTGQGFGRSRAALLVCSMALMPVALIGLVSNMAVAQASGAARNGEWSASARFAKRANAWAPWLPGPYRLLGEAALGQGETVSSVSSFNKAIAKSPDDWNLWFDLARATTGNAQRDALRHAKQLNPLSPEIAELQKEIDAEKVIDVVPKSPAQP